MQKKLFQRYHFLIKQDLEGEILKNETLYINAAGLENGLRNKRDGYSFFGCVKEYVK